jgi:ribosomal-protein-alanine N-acetyltransferase
VDGRRVGYEIDRLTTDRPPADPRRGDQRIIQLVELAPEVIHALAAGDLASANRIAPFELTPYFVEAKQRSTWQRRSRQIDLNPAGAGWVTRVIFDVERRVAVGQAGYHGPPDSAGMVEVGYSVDPTYRRQGYARAALEALLIRARSEPSVLTVRATIQPRNAPSRRLVAQYEFVEVGEQWDEEDGLETIFEVSADLAR